MSDKFPPPPPPSGQPDPTPPQGGYGAPPPPAPQGGYGGYGTPPPAPQGGYGAPPPAYSGPGRPGELLDRFLARLIDGVILGVVTGIIYAIFFAILVTDVTYDYNEGDFDGGSTILFGIVFGVVVGVLNIAYYSFMESSRGATIGKQLMKLKVVGPDGHSNPTMEQAVRRNIFTAAPLGWVVPVVGPLLVGLAALVGEIMIAVGINNDTARRQAWHDKFAGGTQVLKIG